MRDTLNRMSTRPPASLPRVLLHAEGATLLGLAIFLYAENGESWWWWLLLLAPDIGMLGYAAGARIGALAYNAFHSYPAPAVLAAAGVAFDAPSAVALALVWFAHIGLDRLLGYGLKYPTDFKDTHLGHV